MDIGLVVGPWGVTFDEAVSSMRVTEQHGFSSYYLGDHFYTVDQIDSLDPYLLFGLAARETERIRFGSLVTPVMFRPPSNVGRLAAQLDVLSGGRFVLGLGVGWNEGEHAAYGIEYPSLGERFDRLDEYLEVMGRMWGEGPASFEGRYYRLREAQTLPKPPSGRPSVLIAGGGERRTLPLVAKYADAWNAVDLPLDAYRHKCELLAGYCDEIGRDPGEIRHTMTTMGLIGSTDAEVEAATLLQMQRMPPPPGMSPADYREMLRGIGAIMGTPDEIVDKLGRLAAQLDLLSGGRFVMGLGVGWHEGEHRTYGVDYPSIRERSERLDEYIQVMQAMWGEGPASFDGRYYQLREADMRPKPAPGRPTVLIAGGGERRTLPLVAKHAHEWNSVDLSPDAYRRKCELLAGYCDDIGRDPGEIRHTMMTMGLIGATDADLEAEAALQMLRRAPPSPMSPPDYVDSLRQRGAIMGSPDQMVDRIGQLAESGVDEVVFIWFNLSSNAVPDWLAKNVLPQVAKL